MKRFVLLAAIGFLAIPLLATSSEAASNSRVHMRSRSMVTHQARDTTRALTGATQQKVKTIRIHHRAFTNFKHRN